MTIIEDTLRIITSPARVLFRPAISFLADRLSPTKWQPRAGFSLPCGCDNKTATALWFSIRQATEDDVAYKSQVAASDLWVRCLIASQYTSERLLVEMRSVEFQIHFWENRLREGGNRVFLLLSQGPLTFFRAVRGILRPALESEIRHLNATDSIEQRLAMLRTILRCLAVSLARMHQAARHLIITPKFGAPGDDAANGSSLVEEVDGSTAWEVAVAADVCTQELLRAQRRLRALSNTISDDAERKNPTHFVEQRKLLCSDSFPIADLADIPAPGSRRQASSGLSRSLSLTAAELSALPDMLASCHKRLRLWSQLPEVRADLDVANPDEGLRDATRQAHTSKLSFVSLPNWLCAPSHLERHWLHYTVNAVILSFAARFVVVHSPICGSDDLERWAKQAMVSVSNAVRDNIVKPLVTVRDEFFETFKSRSSIVSRADFEASKESLRRMLADFEADTAPSAARFPPGRAKPDNASGDKRDQIPGMENLMRHYEEELRHPIRNALSGTLPRSLLIQVQKLKVDTESAMLEMDQILRANELTMAVTAALPAILIAGSVLYLAVNLFRPRQQNLRLRAAPARLAMVQLERAIDSVLPQEDDTVQREDDRHGGESAPDNLTAWEKEGVLLLRVAQVRSQTIRVFTPAMTGGVGPLTAPSYKEELRQIEEDLFAIAASPSSITRSRIAERMNRVYALYKA